VSHGPRDPTGTRAPRHARTHAHTLVHRSGCTLQWLSPAGLQPAPQPHQPATPHLLTQPNSLSAAARPLTTWYQCVRLCGVSVPGPMRTPCSRLTFLRPHPFPATHTCTLLGPRRSAPSPPCPWCRCGARPAAPTPSMTQSWTTTRAQRRRACSSTTCSRWAGVAGAGFRALQHARRAAAVCLPLPASWHASHLDFVQLLS